MITYTEALRKIERFTKTAFNGHCSSGSSSAGHCSSDAATASKASNPFDVFEDEPISDMVDIEPVTIGADFVAYFRKQL